MIGSEFGATPMGLEQVRARAERRGRELLWPEGNCTCEPEMLALDVPAVACPDHGLSAFLRKTFRTEVPA